MARETIAADAARLGAPSRVIEDVRLCVSEAATNVVRHAYADDKGEIRITLEASEGELTVRVRDDGVGLEGFQREGELGHGLRIIDRLTRRFAVTSAPHAGTELRMVFSLETRGAET
jgi:anti-sigma regulatory factor (Ser/Thr protein kinase)